MRRFLLLFMGLFALASSCLAAPGDLSARPMTVSGTPAPGLTHLPGGALLYIPPLSGPGPWPLVLLLHGAGQRGEAMVGPLRPLADAWRVVLVAPDSSGVTWDWLNPMRPDNQSRLGRRIGPDQGRIDQALTEAFARVSADPHRIALLGFSDGATYGLDLGVRNPDLFSRIIAMAPGTLPSVARGPGAAIFIAHGAQDKVLPVRQTARETVPALRRRGFQVTYHEFTGGHAMPDTEMRAALSEWLGPPP